jgi:proteasome lid subunit RPN8/RPN11
VLGQVDEVALQRLRLGAHIEVPAGTQGIRRTMSDLSVVSGNEVALVRMQSGRRVMVMGEPNAVVLPPQTARVIAHTHPQGSLRLSTFDVRTMNRLNQRSTVIIAPRENIGVRLPVPRTGGP